MSTVQVDTINESTTGSGVTVDGVLIKDGSIASTAISGQGLTLIKNQSYSSVNTSGTDLDNIFTTTYDNYYDCLMAGYEEAVNKQKEIGRQETNAHQIFIRFSCKPINEI